MKRALGVAAAAGAVIAVLVSTAAVKWYVWDVAIRQSGEADRSMLFWGLPILFIGLGAAGAATGLIFVAREILRSSR